LQGKLLASAALSYVAAVLAQSMGFTQLFFALKAKPALLFRLSPLPAP
jgi:hypothetical protein